MRERDINRALVEAKARGISTRLPTDVLWGDALRPILRKDPDILDDLDDVVQPLEVKSRVDPDFQDWIDEMLVARETPKMRAQINPATLQVIEQLAEELKSEIEGETCSYGESRRIPERVASLLICRSVPLPVFINVFANATAMRPLEADFHVSWMLEDLRLDREEQAMQPVFDSDNFSAIADFIYDSFHLTGLTAEGAHKFFFGEDNLPVHLLDALIEYGLSKSSIWDRQRKQHVGVSNKLVAEIRGAMARKHPRLANERESAESLCQDASRHSGLASRCFSDFAGEMLRLKPGSWTSSEALFLAYTEWCRQRGIAPEERAQFFKGLVRWAADRARSVRTRVDGSRVQGYAGIDLVTN